MFRHYLEKFLKFIKFTIAKTNDYCPEIDTNGLDNLYSIYFLFMFTFGFFMISLQIYKPKIEFKFEHTMYLFTAKTLTVAGPRWMWWH